ncbi:ABC transporter ATP-binding protein [Nocardioides sp. NBC_00850]|uniref:ABC transporter ATP-binding protein n=1 Tax=Nocardioides sp. NBC_00850 TaxID=2976001 RepID=UPI0038644E31|nr:ABC transporter ATP-binding protein [Nocardioides sp. NBC_00850]
MIQLRNLTKRYGDKTAVDDLTLDLEPGSVTGFLGPNGAGKSTTMRLILGLDAATSGTATVDGKAYADLDRPAHTIGALLDAKAVHPGRSGRDHLRAMARSQGIEDRRVDEVLELTGMTAAGRRRAGMYSLGMSQRLGIAGALLGDPKVLMLDEPVNGLDPDGVRWIRTLLRGLAAEGRTVFVSSHLMSEMEQTADRLVVLGRGRLVADAPMSEFLSPSGTRVRGPDLGPLADLLAGHEVTWHGENELTVAVLSTEEVGTLAHRAGVLLHLLEPVEPTLEESYVKLTADAVEYTAGGAA